MGLEERKKGQAPKKSTDFQRELDEAILRFKAAFELLQVASRKENSDHLLTLMQKELDLMDTIATAVDRKGVRKWEQKLSKDAQAFISDQNKENFEILQQDIATLAEVNRRPWR